MTTIRIGNVFKLNEYVRIVYKVDNDLTYWISLSYEGSSGCTPNVTKPCDEQCWSCNTNDSDEPDYDCEKCKGTGYYKSERIGMDRAVFLASNVKDYILKGLKKNFEF